MLTRLSQEALHFDCPPMVGIGGWNVGESGQHFYEFSVIGGTLGAESEFKRYRGAHRDAPFGDQGSSSGGDNGLPQSRKSAGVSQIKGSRQLLVPAPSSFDGIEVEALGLAEQTDQLKAPLGVDDLEKRGMNGFTQRLRPQDFRSLLGDISIYKNRCLGHKLKISRQWAPVSKLRTA